MTVFATIGMVFVAWVVLIAFCQTAAALMTSDLTDNQIVFLIYGALFVAFCGTYAWSVL